MSAYLSWWGVPVILRYEAIQSSRFHSLTFWQKVTKAYQIFHGSFCYLFSARFRKFQKLRNVWNFYENIHWQIIKIHHNGRSKSKQRGIQFMTFYTNIYIPQLRWGFFCSRAHFYRYHSSLWTHQHFTRFLFWVFHRCLRDQLTGDDSHMEDWRR